MKHISTKTELAIINIFKIFTDKALNLKSFQNTILTENGIADKTVRL